MANIKIGVRKPYYGWGINDADYVTQPGDRSKRCPIFDTWHSMVRRCYSKNSLSRNSIYEDKYVAEDWKHFTDFKKWMEVLSWEGLYLDKDILVMGNKVYSPDTCVFVPQYINTFFAVPCNGNKKSNYPLGVNIKPRLITTPFVGQGSANGKRTHLGCAATPEEAHILWQKWKLTEIDRVRAEYENEGYVHEGVIVSLNTTKENLTNDIESGRITPRLSWKRE